jgi:hypothetical protein
MRRWGPRAAALRAERTRTPPAHAHGDAFAGFAVPGIRFEGGHILGFHRMRASSLGPPFASIWHRTPARRWRFITDVEPGVSSPRYFADASAHVAASAIHHGWRSDDALIIEAPDAGISWCMRVQPTAATRLINGVLPAQPAAGLRHAALVRGAGWAAGRLLGGRPMVLTGTTPSGHRFGLRPRALWLVTSAVAVIDGRDAGPMLRLRERVALADWTLPDPPLLVVADTFFDAPAEGSAPLIPRR